jgi:uncharacterized protein (TIGR02001 family)
MNRSALPAALVLAATLPAPLAHASEWGGIFSAVTYASEYRFHGLGSSDKQPVIQGYVHWYRPDGFYLGAFATQVDYAYDQSPDYEIDLYGGKTWRVDRGRTELKAEAMVTTFPDNRTPGPTFDFVQVKLGAKRTLPKAEVGASVSFVPDGPFVAGRGWRATTEGTYALTPNVKLKALAGHVWTGRGQDRSYWEAGAAVTWKRLTFEARYLDTDLSRRQCGFNADVCGGAFVGSVTVALPPLMF